MDDILGHIAAQLAEFKALKEKQGGPQIAPPDMNRRITAV